MEGTEVRETMDAIRAQVARVVVGQEEAVDLLLTALLAEGHVLLEGMPGLAKTLLARTFAAGLGLGFRRIQFTPDLMPGDVTGTNLFDFRENAFHLVRGPIFTEVLLADEVNRTPPKTQSALLQAMQERAVTIDGTTHELGDGFFVVATQNPIEHEGTYPLPEAQLDRFLFKVRVGYPDRDEERALVRRHGGRGAMPRLEDFDLVPVADLAFLAEARRLAGAVHLEDEVLDYTVDVVRATREHPALLAGASPRATSMLVTASRARALLAGREYVIPDDVKALGVPALAHRVVLSPAAEVENASAVGVVEEVLRRVAAPK